MPSDEGWPRTQSVPRQRPGVTGVELDDNLAVYDDVGELLILLNAGAAAVWTRCDGVTTVGALVADLQSLHENEPAGAIEEDVVQTIRKLADLGLVDDASAGSVSG